MQTQPSVPAAAAQHVMDLVCRVAMPLALGVTLLLFLQWPLRELAGAGSTLANDSAQALFALYVACAVRHAGVRGGHLVARPDLAPRPGLPTWRDVGAALCVLPWSLCVLVLSAPAMLHSVRMLESFPESFNPGYFIIRIASTLLALLLALQALLDLVRALRPGAR